MTRRSQKQRCHHNRSTRHRGLCTSFRRTLHAELLEDRRMLAAQLAAHDVTVNEGVDGYTRLIFEVQLSGELTEPVSVDYQTVDDTATAADGDYESKFGHLTWDVGDTTSRFIVINAVGDSRFESDESFRIVFSSVQGAEIIDDIAVGTLLDDDTILSGEPIGNISDAEFAISAIRPADESEQAFGSYWGWRDKNFEEFNGRLYFGAAETPFHTYSHYTIVNGVYRDYDDGYGRLWPDPTGLWSIDPVSQQYAKVADVPILGIDSIISTTDRLFFKAYAGSGKYKLYSWDGPGNSPLFLAYSKGNTPWWSVGDKLYFIGDDTLTGNELWVTDGIAGTNNTYPVKDHVSGTASPRLILGTEAHGGLFLFSTITTLPLQITTYVTDGTKDGYRVLLTGSTSPPTFSGGSAGRAVFNGQTYFGVGAELWRTDGIQAHLQPGPVPSNEVNNYSEFYTQNEKLFFQVRKLDNSIEYWQYDGNSYLELDPPDASAPLPRGIQHRGQVFGRDGADYGNDPFAYWRFDISRLSSESIVDDGGFDNNHGVYARLEDAESFETLLYASTRPNCFDVFPFGTFFGQPSYCDWPDPLPPAVVSSLPQAILPEEMTVSEGSSATVDVFKSILLEPEHQVISWDTEYDGVSFVERATTDLVVPLNTADGPNSYRVALKIRDTWGHESVAVTQVHVVNEKPTVEGLNDISGPIGSPIMISANIFDVGANDTLSIRWEIDDTLVAENVSTFEKTFTEVGEHFARLTVTDNDNAETVKQFRVVVGPPVTLQASAASLVEGQSVRLTASIESPLEDDVLVPLSYGGTAEPAKDFGESSQSPQPPTHIRIPAGSRSGFVDITNLQDSIDEEVEILQVIPGIPSNASLASSVPLSIELTDDDEAPNAFVASSSQVIVEQGITLPVIVSLDTVSGRDVVIRLGTSGTATPGADYVLQERLLVIPAGELTAATTLTIFDDNLGEGTEQIVISIEYAQNATATGESLTHVVPANDIPTIGFDSVLRNVSEAAQTHEFIINISNPADSEIVANVTLSGDAIAGVDYVVPPSNLEVTIQPGQTSVSIPIALIDNEYSEPDRSLIASISGIIGATPGPSLEHLTRIVDDDSFFLTVSSPSSVWEDEGLFIVRAELTKEAIDSIVIPLVFSGTAVRDKDYRIAFDSIVIPPGQTFGEVAIVFDDNFTPGSNLRIETTVISPPTVKLRGQSTVATTIRDNDPFVTFSALGKPPSTMLLNEGGGSRDVQIYLDRPVNHDVTVNLKAYAATASKHDFSVPSSVTIPANPNRPAIGSFSVKPTDDLTNEANESFSIAISSVSNGYGWVPHPQIRTFQIVDNDAPPEPYWIYSGATVQEGSSSLIFIGVQLARTAETDVNAKISLGGTATLGADYSVLGKSTSTFTLTFSPNTLEQWIPIVIYDDDGYEGIEYIDLHLSTGGRDPKTFTIPLKDNDSKPRKRTQFETFVDKTTDYFKDTVPFSNLISTEALSEAWESLKRTSINDLKNIEAQVCIGLAEIPTLWGTFLPKGCVSGEQIQWFIDAGIDSVRNSEAIHGAVDGATLFVDLNFNEVQDFLDLNSNGVQDFGERSEPSFETDYAGATPVAMTSDMDADRNGQFDDDELQLVSVGGTDISTGYEISVPLVAPASFSIVSPLTTLVAKLARLKDMNTEQAMSRVAAALDLPRKDLLNVNLLLLARNDDMLAADAFSKSTQVYSTAHQIAYFLSGFDNAPGTQLLGSLAMQDMAEKIRFEGSLLDLSDVFVVQSLIRGTISRSDISAPDSSLIAAAATVIASSNAMMGAVAEADGRTYVEEVARIQKVSEGSAAERLRALAEGTATEQATVNEFTGDRLAALVDASEIGNVVIPYIVADDIAVVEGDQGTQIVIINVGITDPSNLPVSVNYSTVDVSATAGSDYGSVTGTLTWSPGDTTVQQIQIPIYGDSLAETNELFHLLLTDAVNAATLETISFVQIVSDDPIEVALEDSVAVHELYLRNGEAGLQLLDNGDAIFKGSVIVNQELLIESAADSQSNLTVSFQTNESSPRVTIRYLGNGANSSLIIDPSNAASIEHIFSSSQEGRFNIDGRTIIYEDIGNVVSPVSPVISGIPTESLRYGDLLTLVGTPPSWFDSGLATNEIWTLTRDSEQVASVVGSSLSINVDAVGVYRMTYTASQEGYLPAVATFEFAILNIPPIGADDTVTTDEDHFLSVAANNGLLSNDSDEVPGELRVASINGVPVNEETPFGLASATQNSSIAYSTMNVNAGNYYGVRFEVTEPINIDRVGASFGYGLGQNPFAAIIRLDNATDVPDSYDLTSDDVLARTTIPVAYNDSGDRFGTMDLEIQPGWYALMVGGEGDSNAALRLDNVALTNPSLYLHSRLGVPEYFSITAANPTSRMRFIVEGSSTGGAATILLGSGATVTANSDGSFRYDPANSFEYLNISETAMDQFVYTITDVGGLTANATATVTVNGVNDAPVASDNSYLVSEESLMSPAASVGLLSNDSDVDSQELSVFRIENQPFGNAVTLPSGAIVTAAEEPNRFIYDPRFAFNHLTFGQIGSDSFTYTIEDEYGAQATATAYITINGWNDAPVALDDNYVVSEDLLLSPAPEVGLLANDSDPEDSQPLVTYIENQPFGTMITLASGAVITAADEPNRFIYDPRAAFAYLPGGQTGHDRFSYLVTDKDGLTAVATVNLTINGVNDAAQITGDLTEDIAEDTDFISGLLFVSDVDSGESSFAIRDLQGTYGRFILADNGSWVYDLNNALVQFLDTGETVSEAFTVWSYDGTAQATLTFLIIGGNDSDTDGVGDDVELAASAYCTIDNFSDCNRDGVDDRDQDNQVATLPNAVTGDSLTVSSPDGTTLTHVMSTTTPSFDVDLPADVEFPIGFTQFTVELAPGMEATEITLFFEKNQAFNAVYKFGFQPGQDPETDEPSVFEFPTYDESTGIGAEIHPDRIILHLRDGQFGDLDLQKNGFISDPIGLALKPGIGDDYVGLDEDGVLFFDPLLNDILPGLISITSWTQPAFGTVTFGSGVFRLEPDPNANGLDQFDYSVIDGNHQQSTATVYVTVKPINDVPVIESDTIAVEIDEGAIATVTGTWRDVDVGDSVTLSVSLGTIVKSADDRWTWSFASSDGPSESQTITVTADDGYGGVTDITFDLTVLNVAPNSVTIDPEVSEAVFAVGGLQQFRGSFEDASPVDTHSGSSTYWTFTHLDEQGVLISETRLASVTPDRQIDDSFAFENAGVYYVTLTVTDDDGSSTTSAPSTFVVYDPSAGFVTGGGWINSPPGADRQNQDLAGRVSFGFISKYQKGANTPSGQTQFNFAAGDLDFHSDSYEWLVVSGARAQFKGTGTINGLGNYGFLLTAIDGQVNGGGGVDKFRIKIWDRENLDTIRYDNQVSDDNDDNATPSTELGGGQILIHSGGKKQTMDDGGAPLNTVSAPWLTKDELQVLIVEGIKHWSQQGFSAGALDALYHVEFALADLPGYTLGTTSDSTNLIWIDVDAAGKGWNIGSQPFQVSSGRVDLLSTITHELGHVLGLTHDLIDAYLEPGLRNLPHLLDDRPQTDFPVFPTYQLAGLDGHEHTNPLLEQRDARPIKILQYIGVSSRPTSTAEFGSWLDEPLLIQRDREEKQAEGHELAIDEALDALMQDQLDDWVR
ncbi:MAG: tandem-95 repeat protein [Planctomycetales bacterium]|nr:tandem-95 repeat protein [Planctomycetales bacterium]